MSLERFARVRAILGIERDKVLEELKGASSNRALVEEKVALEEAIKLLALFDGRGIRKIGRVIQVPLNATPSSDFRLICDNESDDRCSWTEVVVDGERVRPVGLSLIVEPA